MKHWRRTSLIIASLMAFLPAASLASARMVGQTLVYDLNEVNQSSILPGLPAASVAKFQALNGKPLTSTLSLSVDRVNPDGSAHVNASIVAAAVASEPASLRDPMSNFQATLAADGRIIPTYDASLQPAVGAGGVLIMTPAIAQNSVAGATIGRLDDFNAFARGCGERAAIRSGDTWRLQQPLSYMMADLSFMGGAKGSIAGHDTVFVSMNFRYQGSNSSETIVASGHYDPTRHLVVDFHDELRSASATGPASRMADFKLHP